MGKLNKADCWYLYTATPYDCKSLTGHQRSPNNNNNDQTLEILMTDLDPDKMKLYYQANCASAKEATDVSRGRWGNNALWLKI